MRILHLYRPALPSLRAQSIQVLSTCHALACLGHNVTLFADRHLPGQWSQTALLENLGLPPVQGNGRLQVHINPFRWSPAAGVWFRRQVAQWWKGPPGTILARDKKRLIQAVKRHDLSHRIILETHELDSALAEERGDDPTKWQHLERAALSCADALVANCGGTMKLWADNHTDLPDHRMVVHNATSASRLRSLSAQATDPLVRVVGTLPPYKGCAEVIEATEHMPCPLEWIGGSDEQRSSFQNSANFSLLPPIAYPDVPDLLNRSQVLLLPLTDNVFGRSLTSPLKIWDYLATTRPIVVPDLPTMREIGLLSNAALHWYPSGSSEGLVQAVNDALVAPPRKPFLRTWEHRATQIQALFQ